MNSIVFSLVTALSLTACMAAEPPQEIQSQEIVAAPAALSCTGKVRCACFVTNEHGGEAKVSGSDFAGTCDANNNCKATCAASCSTGVAKVTGDGCHPVTQVPKHNPLEL